MEDTDAINSVITYTALVVCSLGAATMPRRTETLHMDRHRYGLFSTLLPESMCAVFQDGHRYILCSITWVHYRTQFITFSDVKSSFSTAFFHLISVRHDKHE